MSIVSGDNSYVIASAALTMIMTPGLGFFYGGMVNKKNMLTTIAYCFIVFSIVSVVWALIGFSLVFGDTTNSGFLGGCSHCGLLNVNGIPNANYGPTVPVASVFFFQLKFAAITPALILGTVTGRVKLSFFALFTVVWTLIVYCPIAHWMWNVQGWANVWGIQDFAGGNVVHISSGTAALACAIYLGKRKEK